MWKKLDPNLLLLVYLLVFFTGVLIFVEYRFNSDAQVFQVIVGIITGISGAFLGHMKPQPNHEPDETKKSTTVTTTQTTPEPPVA